MVNSPKAAQWIRSQIFAIHREGRCKRICIKHVAGGKLSHEIFEVEIPEAVDDVWITSALADIDTYVEMDAGGLGGMQQYCALVYREKSGDRSTGRYSFRVSVEEDSDDLMLTEAPTKAGIIGQCMRHTEAMMRNSTVAIGQVISSQARTVERLAAENETMHKQQARIYEMLEDLSQRRHERDMDIRKQELKDAMTREIVEKVNLLLPAVVNKLAGARVLPGGIDPAKDVLQQFLNGLNDSQLNTIMGILTPEQRIALGSVIEGLTQ